MTFDVVQKRKASVEWHSLYDFAFLNTRDEWVPILLRKGYDNEILEAVWCKRHGWEYFNNDINIF